MHTVRSVCNQENYANHLKDFINKSSELEQQFKFKKPLLVLKAA